MFNGLKKWLGGESTEEVYPNPLTQDQLRGISLSAILQQNAKDRCDTRLYPLGKINQGIAVYELQVKRWDVTTPEKLDHTLNMLAKGVSVNTPNGQIALPLAWRMGNIVDIARFAFAAQYIDEAKAWHYINYALQTAAAQYPSWQEYATDYLQGASVWWAHSGMVDAELAATFKDEDQRAAQKLLDPQNTASPWQQVKLRA